MEMLWKKRKIDGFRKAFQQTEKCMEETLETVYSSNVDRFTPQEMKIRMMNAKYFSSVAFIIVSVSFPRAISPIVHAAQGADRTCDQKRSKNLLSIEKDCGR